MQTYMLVSMIGKYVEERFSTYTSLMEAVLEAKETIQDDEKILARFSNFMAFSENIQSEVKNIFGVDIVIDKREYEDYNRMNSRIYETHIIYENIAIGHYGFSLESRLVAKYITEGNKYERIN